MNAEDFLGDGHGPFGLPERFPDEKTERRAATIAESIFGIWNSIMRKFPGDESVSEQLYALHRKYLPRYGKVQHDESLTEEERAVRLTEISKQKLQEILALEANLEGL